MEKDTQKDIKSIRLDFRVTPDFKRLIQRLMVLHGCKTMTELLEKSVNELEKQNQ